MSTKQKQLAWLMGIAVAIAGLGCASSYHRYSGCCEVDCRYCEPGPLRYRHYPGCTCHSNAGARYLSRPAQGMSRTGSDSSGAIVTEERDAASKIDEPVSPAEREPEFDISQRPYDE